MAIQRVIDYFDKLGMKDNIKTFTISSATVELAAIALKCDPQRIAKTLSFDVDGKTILIVTSGDAKIDNSKFRHVFHKKAKMLPSDQVESIVGHSVGGVCPFAVNSGISVYLDRSLERFDTVFPACGSDNSAIELTIKELYKYSNCCCWIDVCKGWS